jgi:hypothetical protein
MLLAQINEMADQFKDAMDLQTICRPAKWGRMEDDDLDDDGSQVESMEFKIGDILVTVDCNMVFTLPMTFQAGSSN